MPTNFMKLSRFDAINLVIGAIIGADIYVASGLTAGMIGPLSIIAWLVAGIFAIIIALNFAHCSILFPGVGGPYAYVKKAFGNFAGFVVGWSLWLAEWAALAVFLVAFARYLEFFVPLGSWEETSVKFALMAFLTVTNIRGVKLAGRTNDVLTIAKLAPLLVFIVAGLAYFLADTGTFIGNYTPLSPFGLGSFGAAVVLIFWAYAGFELVTIPAGEIENPRRTIPRAIVTGMAVVMAFYMLTNFVIYGAESSAKLSAERAPLMSVSSTLFGFFGIGMLGTLLIWVGALLSISGADESGTIGTSRLGYAMAADGLLPRAFARLHPKYRTPYAMLLFQGATAFVASLLGTVAQLIVFSVFFFGIAYAATSLSLAKLSRLMTGRRMLLLPAAGVLISAYLITQTPMQQIAVGLALIALGVPVYTLFSPKSESEELRQFLLSEETVAARRVRLEERFLAHALRHAYKAAKRIMEKVGKP